ncbi:hypothetical protein CVT25_002368 [Psilocybe cyanescens]|uniref:Uncharacterized protein n=1 Tax=Psilocybe cyanescens TaxID=93625 RepID=A0A409WK64_PSICY|nr:hypothetical protein CVT25_002368 [Psilocybe cyanescens]
MSAPDSSRPTTPESPFTYSLYHATSTIDDLTAAMANFSRVPSPDPVASLSCCCEKEDCENLKAWLELKSRLGSRLVLSAEVGQALLQRHAAYVRQSERRPQSNNDLYASTGERTSLPSNNDELQNELEELVREKAQLEKRLNQALVNNEVTEVSSKTILHELQEARETISRLTAHHARSVGWDTRLSAALKERDDMQQERDEETHRARLSESRFAALKEKTAKLQHEVRRLQESLEEKRHNRLELSETILQDARSRLDSFRTSHLGVTAKVEEEQLTTVLESLVQDNDTLKRDNAELQHLLSESREDLHILQEELDEQRATTSPLPRSGANTPHSRHFHSGSVPSISLKDFTSSPNKGRRNNSAEGRSRRRSAPQSIDIRRQYIPSQEPLTPDTARSPNSFSESLAPADKWNSFGRISPSRSPISYEIQQDTGYDEHERSKVHKPLLLLTRSRSTQTDHQLESMSPSPLPSQLSSLSPHEQQSETSSFSESQSQSSHVSVILERVTNLLNRLSQADALTLTNRLKRQHLKGADVGHLSRSTVDNIVAEATGLRSHFRMLLEDEKTATTCSRKDLRVLFKLVKDIFTEMGHMRVTLNDVVLDPSSAPRLSELALNPGKAEAEKREREKELDATSQGGVTGWMAPISKLFSPTGRENAGTINRNGLARSTSSRDTVRPPRFVPKLGPALAASAMTVNVEFSGSGVGRSVTSTFSAQPIPATDSSTGISSATQGTTSGLMDIFAGAPRNVEPDPWVVVPSTSIQTLRKAPSFMNTPDISTATIGRSNGRKNINRLSRNVDAVIDVERPQDVDEASDYLPPLLERTLRRRGLSDSSLHSTFTSHGDDPKSPHLPPSPQRPVFAFPNGQSSRLPAWPDRTSMFQVLSRTVQNLRASTTTPGTTPPFSPPREAVVGVATAASPLANSAAVGQGRGDPSPGQPSTPRKAIQSKSVPVASPGRGANILPNLTSWAASSVVFDPVPGADPFVASSHRDESYMQERPDTDESHSRDYY